MIRIAPILYAIFCIVLPIYLLDTNYFWSTVIHFWIPSVILMIYLRKKILWTQFLLTWAFFNILSIIWEYAGLALNIWDFSEAHHALLGPEIFGAPIEEFVFWFGASPFVLTIYIYYEQISKR